MANEPDHFTHVFFLAGGKGSRIQQLTRKSGLPKQLLEIEGQSSLGHGVETISQALLGVCPVIVSSPHWSATFKDKFPQIAQVIQPAAKGNADALKRALDQTPNARQILCLNSDHLFGLTVDEIGLLAQTHVSNHWLATILLEQVKPEDTQLIWHYDQNQLLQSRSIYTPDSPRQNSGFFTGILALDTNWARPALDEECTLANSQDREAKIPEVVLRYTSTGQIGIFPSLTTHYGINTQRDYFSLARV